MEDIIKELIRGILFIIGFFTSFYWTTFFISRGWSNGVIVKRRQDTIQDTITIGNELMETIKEILSNRK